MKLIIRNMVCGRCKRVVRQTLEELGFTIQELELGEVDVTGWPSDLPVEAVRKALLENEFELIDDKRQVIIEHIKTLLINEIQYQKGERNEIENFSTFLERKLGYEYSYLSHLFSTLEGQTIERYTIALKIEKVKEWLRYDEMSLSEIAFRLGYSSSQHLSNQFRQVVGQTPGQFKRDAISRRQELDKI